MRVVVPVLALLAAGAVFAAPPNPRPLTAAQKARVAQAKAAKALMAARAAAAKRAKNQAGGLPSRGSLGTGASGERIGQPFFTTTPAGGSQLPAPRLNGAPLFFRTAADYDVRLDLKPDFVAVQRPAATWEELGRHLQSWKAYGYPAYRLVSLGRDPGAFFTSGRADGAAHPEEVELNASGTAVGPESAPAVALSPAWVAHLKEHLRRGLDAGADGFILGDGAAPSAGGHSPAFRKLFPDHAWKAPQESPTAFYQASRLKSDLALGAVNDVLRHMRELSREKGRAARFLVSLPSPLTAAENGDVFPAAAVSRLPVDGVIGEISLTAARTPIPDEGKLTAHPFAYHWLSCSYFANLMDGLPERPLFLSVPPGETDPSRSSADYDSAYRQAVGAAFMFPQARGFEAYPWPEVTHTSRSGAVAPPAYLTQLSNLAAALKEAPAEAGDASAAPRGIGILTLDSLGWQRGGPRGSSPRSLYGMALPLLKRGIPVQLVPAERVADPAFLAKYRLLLLSYEAQKPLGPELNLGIAQWVRAGGTLVLLGGEDPYNSVGQWWEKSGFTSPTDHLLRQCNVGVDLIQRTVRQPASPFKTVLQAMPAIQDLQVHTLSLRSAAEPGQPVYLQFGDRTPETPDGLRLRRVRVIEAERVRADFAAGSSAERPFLVEEAGTLTTEGERTAQGSASFIYRFHRLGADARLELELGGDFAVSLASGADPGATLKPALAQLTAVRVPSSYPVVTYPLSGAQALYTSGEGATETTPAWASVSGQGSVIYCGVPAAFAAESAAGAEWLRSLVRYAAGRAGLEWPDAALIVRRGPFVIANGMGRTAALDGLYLDLFKPDFPLVQNPQLPYREPGLYRQVRLTSRIPQVLFATHRARTLESNARRTRVLLEGPSGTEGFLRIFPAGMSLTGVEARGADGQAYPVQVRPDGRTMKVRYPQQARGLNLTLHWVRPEARLTK